MQKADTITMTTKELKRLHLIHKAIDKKITQQEAAQASGLSERQIRRIVARIQAGGDQAIVHASRGKSSNAKLPEKQKQRIISLYKTYYSDFGPTLAREKLLESHRIRISHETLRLWLHKENFVHYRTRKTKPNRMRRERRESFGSLVQMDGSHHDWLEGRGPWLVLMAYIDDATGCVCAEFHDYEGTLPAMTSFYRYALKRGLPLSIYLDKHGAYKVNQELSVADQLEGKEAFRTQFQRALEELGVEVIHANSPQAKGRVERLFGTFQDRLVKELRLSGAETKSDANKVLKTYLPKFNKQFGRTPKNPHDLHRKAPDRKILKRVLAVRHDVSLANDNTVRSEGKIYLIKDRMLKNRTKKIRIEQGMDGKTRLWDGNRKLKFRQVSEMPRLVTEKSRPRKRHRTIPPAPKDHPFRRFVINLAKQALTTNA